MRESISLLLNVCLSTLATIAHPALADAPVILAVGEPPTPVFSKLPAVDGINGKAEMFGGAENIYYPGLSTFPGFGPPFSARDVWRGGGGGAGSVSVPLGHDFGAQVDSILGPWNGHTAAGGAGHVFWRDPAVALLGVYGSGLYWGSRGGVFVGRAAGEGEGYFGRFTAKALIGAEFLGASQPAFSPFGVTPFGAPYFLAVSAPARPARFFDKVTLSYYLTDNLAFSVGHSYTGRRNAAVLGAEYLIPQTRGGGTAASLFVEGRVGEKYANSVMAGLRIYFGNSDKSLIRRHREDDPATYFSNDSNTLTNSFRNTASNTVIPLSSGSPAPTDDPPSPSCMTSTLSATLCYPAVRLR